MTPAQISVERLRATVVFNRDVQSTFPHMETDPEGQYVRHSDYAALLQQLAELQAKTACTLGVGDGSGQLFVHGDYESIKAAQGIIDKLAEREAEVARLERDRDGWKCAYDVDVSRLIDRANAAERAGDEARTLLTKINRFGVLGLALEEEINAFLAASGGNADG